MDYLNTLTANPNGAIHKAIQLIQQLPVSHKLTNLYHRSTRNELLFIGATTFLTLYNLSSYLKAKREKLNLPPTVPFSLPFAGHTLYVIFFHKKFIDWCNSRYGEIYNISYLGKTIAIANGKSAEEAMKAESSELSLEHGILRDVLHFHYVFEESAMQIAFNINPTIAKLTVPSHMMPYYIPGIQQGLEIAVKDLMSATEPTIINQPSKFFQRFVSYMSVPTLVGDEVATNPEVIKSFAEFTGDITNNVPLFMAVPKSLHRFILPYLQSAHKHHVVMEKHVMPIITERRKRMKEAEEAGQPHNLSSNFLQGLIEYAEIKPDGSKVYIPDKQLSHSVLMIAFASTHTTSINLSFAIYWLIARPDLMQKLIDEIKQTAPGDTPVDAEVLQNMKFLNNFMREVLRQGVDKLANGKKAMVDFTFSNGYQIPKGRIVESNVRQLQFGDNSTRSEIEEMNPEMSLGRSSSSPAKDFVAFGMGKHLCPGRFFAIQEIEMALVHLLRNYDIKTVSGKRPTPVQVLAGKMSINSEDPLIFIPRKL